MSIYEAGPSCQLPNFSELLEQYIGFKANGRFVEVGAYDGKEWSNTYGLAQIGWRGICFEPNPESFSLLEFNHRRHPNIICAHCAIGRENKKTKLFLGGSVSTAFEEVVETYNRIPWLRVAGLSVEKFVEVEMRELGGMLSALEWEPDFDLLTIDAEGAEIDILETFDFDYWRPTMLIIETHELHEEKLLSCKAELIFDIVSSKGYGKVYADTINSVYVREEK